MALRGQAARANERSEVLSAEVAVLRMRLRQKDEEGDMKGVGRDVQRARVSAGAACNWDWDATSEWFTDGAVVEDDKGWLASGMNLPGDVLGVDCEGISQHTLRSNASAVVPQSFCKSWLVSAGSADMAMEFVLTYVCDRGGLKSLTLAQSRKAVHTACTVYCLRATQLLSFRPHPRQR